MTDDFNKNTVSLEENEEQANAEVQQIESKAEELQPQNPYAQNSVSEPAPINNPYYANGSAYYRPSFMSEEQLREQYEIMLKKREVRGIGNSIGIQLCLFFIISIGLSFVLGIIAGIIGRLTGINVLHDVNFTLALSVLINIFAMVLPSFITANKANAEMRELVSFKKAPPFLSAAVVMLGMGVCIISNIATNIFGSVYYSVFNEETVSNNIEYGDGTFSFIISVFCIGIMPALIEEFAFRGVILGSLRKHVGDGSAVLISAAMFSLLHGNLVQIPFSFGMGIILAFATIYTSSIIPAMVIHFINNTFAVVLTFMIKSMSPTTSLVVSALYYAVMLLVGVCGLILLLKTDGNAFKLSNERAEISRRNSGWIITSPAIIVFVVMCVIQVLITQATGNA